MEVILSFIIVAVVVMAAACASAVINIMCEEERDTITIYGEVWSDAEQ